MSEDLLGAGAVCVVTGASRGVGRGVALALGETGATVYLTARTLRPGEHPLPGSLEETAAEITARGGVARPVQCDHANDAEVHALFVRVWEENKRCDVLVNSVFAIPDGSLYGVPFWEQPTAMWDTMHSVGLRSHYVASQCAAPMMVDAGRGLIANISSWGGHSYQLNVAYGVGKAGVDRLTADMAFDLRKSGVGVVSLYPGVVRTERIIAEQEGLPFDMSNTESPEFTGRAIRALAGENDPATRSGKVWVVAELGEALGFDDIDGRQPASLRKVVERA